MSSTVIPSGMVQTTKAEFYARLMAETRNIHPTSERLATDWMLVGTQRRWGWSSKGYASPYGIEEIYAMTPCQPRVGGGA